MKANSRIRVFGNSRSPESGDYSEVRSRFEDVEAINTSEEEQDGQYVSIVSPLGDYGTTRVNVTKQHELDIRERIKKFLHS